MSFFFGKFACVSVICATCYAVKNGSDTDLSPRMDPSYMPAEEASLTHLNFTKEFDLDSVRIEFPPPVKGEDYKVESLGYKDGAFMFGYLGDLISLLSTDKFPLETLREVLSGNGKKGFWDLMKECLENEPGLIALASIAIVLSVLIPLVFLSVCCCRLGGKCGAKKKKVKSKCCLTFAKTTWETLMVLFLLISCVGIILAFVTNMQMRGAVQDAEAVVSAGVADAGAFVRNTALQIRVTTESAADRMLEHVFRDLDAIRTILGRPIQHELASETKFQAAVKDVRDLDADLSRLVSDCGTLLASAQNARLQAASADSALADLTRQVENVIRRCGEADKKFCSKVDYSGYRVSVSFSTYALEEVVSTLRTMVKKEEVSGLATKMQAEFADIPSHIHRTTATLRSNIKSMLRDYRTSLVESTREFDNLFADIQSRMFKFGTHGGALFSEARRYDDVRFFVGLGVSICLLFVWISLLLSICCGCWKSGKNSLENGCAGRFGGGCLLMSVFFIAALSCPLWLAVSGLLVVGSHGQGLVCQTLYEQGFGTLGRIVDGPNNDFGPGGFIGSVIFKNDSFKVPVEDVLRKCEREKSAFGVFHLDHYVDLQNLSRVREITNVEKELETYRLDLSDAITFKPEIEVALKNNISALQIELTTFRLELQRQVLPSNPSLLVDQLEVAAREVRSQATSSQLSTLAARARDVVNNQEDLQETPTRLIAEASLILKTSNATFEHLRKIQYFLKNHAAAVFNHKVRAYSRRIISYLVQFTSYMTQALESEVANCKPVWNIFNQTRIVLCRYIVDPLNGFWFSTSCCLLIFFLSSIVGMKLAKFYRNGYDNGDENGFHRSTWTIVGGSKEVFPMSAGKDKGFKMFNMYLNKDGDRSAQARAEDFTGHDSYGYAHYAKQIKPYRRRKRSDSRSPSSVRHSSDSSRHRSKSRSLRSRRTSSLTYEEKSLDALENRIDLTMEMRRSLRSNSRTRHRIPHMSNKSGRGMASGFESIAKLFNCLSLEDRLLKSKRPNNPDSYTTIKNEGAGLRKAGSDEENKIRAIAARAVHEYVEASGRYVVIEQLEDLGSRISKQWFLVRDEQLKTERLLTIVPYLPPTNGQNHLVMNPSTRSAIKALFQLLQHPYIYPVLDVDFLKSVSDDEWSMLVMVFPFNNKGSLKDLIYKSLWQNNWNQKYCHRSEGLPVMQVQRLGRQILEGLLFLQDRGFPPFGHLHSGNIIIQNGVARITGFENCILGFTSRINSVLRPFLATDPDAVDTLCFGHVLFEMCAGYELGDARPTAKNFSDIMGYPQVVRILHFIFDHPSGTYPSIEKLALLDFFRNIDLREMRSSFVPAALQSKVSRDVAQLLETLCARNGYTRMRSRSMSACDLRSSSSFFDDSGSSPESSSKTRCATPTPCNQQSDNILYLSCGRRASDVSMYGSATVLCECHKLPGLCQNCGELTFHSPLRPSTPVEVESIRAGLNGLHLDNLKSDNNRRNLSLNWGRGDSVYQTPLQSPSEVYAFISAPVVLVTPPENVEMEHVI